MMSDFHRLLVVDTILVKASGVKSDALFAKLEERLRSALLATWEELAFTAVSRGVSAFRTGSAKPAILRAIVAPFKKLGRDVADRIHATVSTAYIEGKREIFAKVFEHSAKVLKGPKNPSLEVGFTLRDERALETMSNSHMHWIGEFYDDGLSQSIDQIVTDSMLQSGLGRVEAGKILAAKLSDRLGAGVVASKPASYFEMMAANVVSNARVRGQIGQMSQIGVATYVISAAGDERMCSRCAYMDGRSVQTSRAANLMDAIDDADTPDQVRELHPWAGKLSDMKDAPSRFPFPPFHGDCRCTVDISEDTEITFEPLPGW